LPDIVVMGNVAYPIDKSKSAYTRDNNRFRRNVRLIHFVDIGEVAFTPSREALFYSEQTLQTLRRLGEEAAQSVLGLAQKDIAEQATAADAVRVMLEWSANIVFSTTHFEWNSLVMESDWREKVQVFKPGRPRNQVVTESYVQLAYLMRDDTLIVTNWGTSTPSKRQKDKMREYAHIQKFNIDTFYLFGATLPGSPWTDNLRTADWEEVNKVTLPKRQYTKGNGDGGYETLAAGWKSSVHEFKQKNLCWARRSEYLSRAEMELLFPNTDFVVLSENRINKFERNYPQAKHLTEFVGTEYERRVKKLTDAQKKFRGMDSRKRTFFGEFDDSRIDDPQFVELIRIAHEQDDPAIDRLARMVYATERTAKLVHRLTPPYYDYGRRYPLINDRWYGSGHMDDVCLYMNAKYAQLKEEGKL